MKTVLVATAILLGAQAALADSPAHISQSQDPDFDSSRPKTQLQMIGGVRFFQYDYSENIPDKPDFKSNEKGVNPGFRLGLRSPERNESAITWQFTADFTAGNLAYDGGLQNAKTGAVTPMTSTSRANFQNYEGSYCFDIFGGSGAPRGCLGAGYHVWDRVVTGTGSIHENYRWLYLPLSVRQAILDASVMQLSLNATFIPLTLGNMTAFLSEGSEADDATVSLTSRPGYRFELPMQLRTGRSSAILLEPWFESTAIGHSDQAEVTVGGQSTGYAIMEPDSRTYQYGIFAGFSVGM